MVRRVSLDAALSGDAPNRAPTPTSSPPAEPETYKLTVVLTEDEHDDLEAITAAVVARIAPRRVGKGWRTKVVRAMVSLTREGTMPTIEAIADRVQRDL